MRPTMNSNAALRWAIVIGFAVALPAVVRAGPAPTLTWHFDESGATPTADDATADDAGPNEHDGVSAGKVTGGAAGIMSKAYSGFTSPDSNVSANLNPTGNVFQNASFSFTAWVKNPDLKSGNALIARAANANLGSGHDVPWQLWVDADGAINLGVQDWEGKGKVYTSAKLNWTADQWYHVAVTVAFSDVDGRSQTFKVYVTPAGSAKVGPPTLEGTYKNGSAGLSNGSTIVIGAGQGGFYPFAPAGSFGGQIDEVNLWVGTTLSTEDLNSTLMVP
jgi:hypothetical protein